MIATVLSGPIVMTNEHLGPLRSARKPVVMSFGEVLWDIFPQGALLGGSAANVAYHAANLGAAGGLISRVGSDVYGRRALEILASANVDISLVSIDPTTSTGTAHIQIKSGEPQFRIQNDVAWDHIEMTEKEVARLPNVGALCFSTLAQRSSRVDRCLTNLLHSVRRKGASSLLGGARPTRPLCVFDLNLREPHFDTERVFHFISLSDVIKLNEAELKWIERETGNPDGVGWLLKNHDLHLVALTRGADGASLYGKNVAVHTPGLKVSGGDPVGAGDAFVAALTMSLLSEKSLTFVLDEANLYASWVAGQLGAMPLPPTRSG